jgi:SNF2 family DNA or RNA helicase
LLFVELSEDEEYLEINFKPVQYHLDRIKSIMGAKFDKKQKFWTVPVECFDEVVDVFEGEIIWVTPRHVITGEPPPPPPKFWSKIPMNQVNLKIPLYPFQVFGAQFLAYSAQYNDGVGFLGDQMGIGKTPQSIGGAEILRQKGIVDKVLVVCLSPLKTQWAEDGIRKFTDAEPLVIQGTPVKRKQLYAAIPSADYVIMNYEMVLQDIDLLLEMQKKGEFDFDLVIFDEAHKMKNRLAKTNIAASKLKIKYKFFLSGTPLMNKPEEIYGLFQVANPKIFGKYAEFKKKHLNYQYNGKFLDLVGYKNLDEIRDKFGQYFLRRTDKEVEMDLPEMTEKNEYVEMTPFQRKLDKELQDAHESANKRVGAARKAGLSKEEMAKIEGAARGYFNMRIALFDSPELFEMSTSANIKDKYGKLVKDTKGARKSPKLDRLLDIVEELVDNGEKVVIFTQFKRMAQILYREIKKRAKTNVVAYYGGLTEEQRTKRIAMFKKRKDCQVFVSTESGSTGLNLQFAKYLINYDLPWTPAIWEQRKGRIRRLGSAFNKVKVINLLVEDSIDEMMYATLEKKQNVFNALIENDSRQSKRLSKLSSKAGVENAEQ